MTWDCQLSVSDGRAPAQAHSLQGSGPFTLGRASSNALPLPHPSVSGRHAELRVTDDGFVEVRDCGSSAGTFVGSERITGWTVVDADTPIWLGDLRLSAVLHFPVERAVIEVTEGRHTARYTVLDAPLEAVLLPADRFPSLQAHLPLTFERERGRIRAMRLADGRLALPEGVRVPVGDAYVTRLAGDDDSLASVLVARGAAETATPSIAMEHAVPPSRSTAESSDSGTASPVPEPATSAAIAPARPTPLPAELPATGNAQRPLTVLAIVAALGGLAAGVAVLWWLLSSPPP